MPRPPRPTAQGTWEPLHPELLSVSTKQQLVATELHILKPGCWKGAHVPGSGGLWSAIYALNYCTARPEEAMNLPTSRTYGLGVFGRNETSVSAVLGPPCQRLRPQSLSKKWARVLLQGPSADSCRPALLWGLGMGSPHPEHSVPVLVLGYGVFVVLRYHIKEAHITPVAPIIENTRCSMMFLVRKVLYI